MSEGIWDDFDRLFKTVIKQGQRVDALLTRIEVLEGKLAENKAEIESRGIEIVKVDQAA